MLDLRFAIHKMDILGLGAAALDHLIFVDAFPPPNVKSRVIRSERQCGGLTASALVAASRLGANCGYAGTLGFDSDSIFVIEAMQREGIDLAHLVQHKNAGPIRSTIIVGEKSSTRNIFPERPALTGAHSYLPDEDVIRSTRVLFVDHVGVTGMIRAAKIARTSNIPVVSDIERDDSPDIATLIELVDHLVVGEEFALSSTGASEAPEAALRLWTPARKLVAVTCGEKGCWFCHAGQIVQHQPAFPVKVVDTTGCGDVFHGAYCAALAKGFDAPTRIRIASVAAALKATKPGAQAGAPSWHEVESFLNQV
jgi:ribokinase